MLMMMLMKMMRKMMLRTRVFRRKSLELLFIS